jgi:hypothetical protein
MFEKDQEIFKNIGKKLSEVKQWMSNLMI